MKKIGRPPTHGHTWRDPATGRSDSSPTYKSWKSMKDRCTNEKHPHYNRYGGRGITVCERWATKGGFVNFLEDMGVRPDLDHSLERIETDGNYDKENCKWASEEEQANNQSNNKLVTVRGETMTLTRAMRKYATVNFNTVLSRVWNGWDVELAMITPAKRRRAA